jgi:hypothetical protein
MKPRYFVFGKPHGQFGVGLRIGTTVLHFYGTFSKRETALSAIKNFENEDNGGIFFSDWNIYTP